MTTRLSKEQAFQKIKQYCAYQERCHIEVKQKLYTYGLFKQHVDEIVSELINENYLNEERFAIQYAGGKFRMNDWGKTKIRYALKQKGVSDYCIKKALQGIGEDVYMAKLEKLVQQKQKTLKSERNIFIKKRKLQDFLMQKGYEPELIKIVINKI